MSPTLKVVSGGNTRLKLVHHADREEGQQNIDASAKYAEVGMNTDRQQDGQGKVGDGEPGYVLLYDINLFSQFVQLQGPVSDSLFSREWITRRKRKIGGIDISSNSSIIGCQHRAAADRNF